MNPFQPGPSLEDVLEAFAAEPEPDRATLERYLRNYPQFTDEIIDLSQGLSRDQLEPIAALSSQDQSLIDAAWLRHITAPAAAQDPFAVLSLQQLRDLAKSLGVPRQVVTAFRERKILVASVPRRFLEQLAAAIQVPFDTLNLLLSQMTAHQPSRSYKADEKPIAPVQATFEQVLRDAQVPDDQRAKLLAP